MEIALHLGVHCTDDDRLLHALMKNRGRLEAAGAALPPSRSYRQMLPKLVRSLRGDPAGDDAQEMVREALLGDSRPRRLILSHENLACYPSQAVGEKGLYPYLHLRLAALANIFPADRCTFFVALRNPATLVPALLQRGNPGGYEGLLGEADPMGLRWRPVLMRMLEAVPDARLVLWCNEDSPLLWPDLLREISGDASPEPLEGEDDMLTFLLSEEGLSALAAYVDGDDGDFPPERVREVTADFLERYARPDEMEMSVDLPGWSETLVAEMTAAYDADVAEIAALPGVNVLLP